MTKLVSRCVVLSLFLLSVVAYSQVPKTPSGHPRLEAEQKVPAIMRATRYWRAQDRPGVPIGKDSNYRQASVLNEAGYAYICVDARGTGASFGTRAYEVTEDEVRDYGEIVDWIVEQSWSNDRVGAMGVSYDGDTAEMLMVNKHPAVKAVAPLYPDFNARDQLIYPGNVGRHQERPPDSSRHHRCR